MKTMTQKPRAKSEEGILKELGLDQKNRLSVSDHRKIAQAARLASQALRKKDPKLAAHLYYIHYKHDPERNKFN